MFGEQYITNEYAVTCLAVSSSEPKNCKQRSNNANSLFQTHLLLNTLMILDGAKTEENLTERPEFSELCYHKRTFVGTSTEPC